MTATATAASKILPRNTAGCFLNTGKHTRKQPAGSQHHHHHHHHHQHGEKGLTSKNAAVT
jgi:hypothetical protein